MRAPPGISLQLETRLADSCQTHATANGIALVTDVSMPDRENSASRGLPPYRARMRTRKFTAVAFVTSELLTSRENRTWTLGTPSSLVTPVNWSRATRKNDYSPRLWNITWKWCALCTYFHGKLLFLPSGILHENDVHCVRTFAVNYYSSHLQYYREIIYHFLRSQNWYLWIIFCFVRDSISSLLYSLVEL